MSLRIKFSSVFPDADRRKKIIEKIQLECDDKKTFQLFLAMHSPEYGKYCPTKEKEDFFKNAVLDIKDSKYFVKLIQSPTIPFHNKRVLAQQVIEHKIPTQCFLVALYFDKDENVITSTKPDVSYAQHECQKQLVQQQCRAIAESKNPTINRLCLTLKNSDKNLHKKVLNMDSEKTL